MATPSDVRQINAFQVIFAEQNIYFNTENLAAEVEASVAKYAPKRDQYDVQVEEFPEATQEEDERHSSLVYLCDKMPDMAPNLSFLKISKRANRLSYQQRLDPCNNLRKTSWSALDEDLYSPFDSQSNTGGGGQGQRKKFYKRAKAD